MHMRRSESYPKVRKLQTYYNPLQDISRERIQIIELTPHMLDELESDAFQVQKCHNISMRILRLPPVVPFTYIALATESLSCTRRMPSYTSRV
jgi:hypothetical protein